MKRTLLLVIVVVMTLGIVACVDTTEESATQVFINGEIFTANEEMLWAGSLAISGDNIICVAEDNSCEEMAGNGTFVVDLDGKMMTPGFIDTHAHMGSAPGLVWGVDITEAETLEDHINMMIGYKAEIDALPEAERPTAVYMWGFSIYATFLDEGLAAHTGGYPIKEILDEIFGDVPTFIYERSGHLAWVNSAALKITESGNEGGGTNWDNPSVYMTDGAVTSFVDVYLEETTVEDYTYGSITVPGRTYPAGEPTGFISETSAAVNILMQLFPVPEGEEAIVAYYESLGVMSYTLASAGVTTTADGGLVGVLEDQFDIADWYLGATDGGYFKQRVFAGMYTDNGAPGTFGGFDIDQAVEYITEVNAAENNELLGTMFFKVFVDGTPDSCTSVMLEDYCEFLAGEPINAASPFTQEALDSLLDKAFAANIDVHGHAMGDGAVRMFIDAVEKAKIAHFDSTSNTAIIHVFFVHPDDIVRMADLEIHASFAGEWISDTPDNQFIGLFVGEERSQYNQPAGRMLAAGVELAIGSDYPATGYIASYEPLAMIESLVTRTQYGKADAGQLGLDEDKLTLDQALIAATLGGARMLGVDDQLGSLEVGKKADLVVIAEDLYALEGYQISSAPVLMTIINGEIVYEAE
ncbi:MAG: amidohydrolase family protein [Candidatus Thiodiazotropha endolucinida]